MSRKTYLVWKDESEREDARKVVAFDAEHAAQIFGEQTDTDSAEYWIVKGGTQRVFVALDEPDSVATLFEVTAEAIPTYYAHKVQP